MSGVPSSATIWFAIWGDRRICWLRGTGQLLFSLKSHPEGPPPDRTIQAPRRAPTPPRPDASQLRSGRCDRLLQGQPQHPDLR